MQVVIVGATKEIGRTAVLAVSKARGMELAGAIDSQCIGEDAGQVSSSHRSFSSASPFYIYLIRSVNAGIVLQISGMDEPLEIPVLNDLTMVLGSIAQVQYKRSFGAVHSRAACLLQDIFGLTALSVFPVEGNWRGCRFQRAFSCLRQCKAGMSIAHLQHGKGYLSCIQ